VNREDLKLLGTDKEVELLVPGNDFYKNFALDASKQQITVDTFFFSAQYTDIASIGTLSQFTGGWTTLLSTHPHSF
jgi:protein transport protein SEC24